MYLEANTYSSKVGITNGPLKRLKIPGSFFITWGALSVNIHRDKKWY